MRVSVCVGGAVTASPNLMAAVLLPALPQSLVMLPQELRPG